MLNPSTADEHVDDPTVRRCIGFTTRLGFARLVVVNFFGWRATEPADLAAAAANGSDIVGAENDAAIAAAVAEADQIVVAWGEPSIASLRRLVRNRMPAMLERLEAGPSKEPLRCLGVTQSGMPRHPLMVPGDQPLVRWQPPAA